MRLQLAMAVRRGLYDVIIVGAGVEGSAAAYHCVKQGAERVLLLEQVVPRFACDCQSCAGLTQRSCWVDPAVMLG